MSERSKDELAVTATAPGGVKDPDAPALGASLGRYRLERELGAGGMGVVHAAFDPDLERRVALKVLRTGDSGGEARQRLLREARALARLTHANVVTVHEVGSASGRDFVAMELIEGETLADWWRGAARDPDEILAAFTAAGRGLAAAHAAGLVHRDFKPHNVLRRKDGRIVVTDFGLARGVEVAVELEATLRLRSAGEASNTPSPLTGLTQTGSVLGTPAYMAPEQWTSAPIGPPADQFAFCVALWEALSGERPFRGATLEALKEEVTRGPAELDASKLPRRVRAALRRGLDPDPAKRWPSMDALLAALSRAHRRPRGIALVVASGVAVAGAVGYVAISGDDDKASIAQVCEPAVLDPAVVWTPAIANDIRVRTSPEIMRAFDAQIATWSAARHDACAATSGARARRLACLDGVLVRFDAVRKASTSRSKPSLDDVAAQLVDPAVCAVPEPPRLPSKLSAAAVEGLALAHHPDPSAKLDTDAEAAALANAKDDNCARALILLARADLGEGPPAREAAEAAADAADTCGDDRARAEALLHSVGSDITALLPKVPKSLAVAESAIRKVAEPNLLARLDLLKAVIAEQGGQFDEQLRFSDGAIARFGDQSPHERLRAARTKIRALQNRRKPGDLEASRKEIARWRSEAERVRDVRAVTSLDVLDCEAQWELGDVAGAHARYPALIEQIAAQRTKPLSPGDTIAGTVVDAARKPVAGAVVVADQAIAADSVGIGLPSGDASARMAKTDAAGAFTLDHVQPNSIIIAQLGNQRSRAQHVKPNDKLVLQPTTTIAGRVVDRSPDQTFVFALSSARGAPAMYQMIAPIRPDGTFTLEGVPVGKLRVGAVARNGLAGQSFAMQEVTVGASGALDVEVRRRDARKLRVVVRSAVAVPLAAAQVFVVAGTVSIKNVKEIEQILQAQGVAVETARSIEGEAPPELHLLAGDLVATFASAPGGVATACALGLSGDLSDPQFFERFVKHSDQVEVRCTPVAPDAKAVTVEVPPMKRFD